ncbi:MAG: serine/threonine-protein kinase [Acidobacteria bacterium]|nr:serine/threonine-protein kinase [Acidobacteriota bacterium]
MLTPGTRLGSYEVLSPLGAGGMGEVYRAKDLRLAREVAIKVLPEDFLEGEERKLRFEREARALAALNHPNIAAVHSFEESGGRHILVMELIEGATLRAKLAEGPLPTKKILSIASQVAEGLAKAHAAGIVHRDLKPENLMVTPDGLVKILDFGLAKLSGPPEASGEASVAPTVSGGTEPGMIMGTVAYMSPEQAVGRPVDFRSDQFSLGAVIYEMVAGRRPFERPTRPETLTAILREEPEPLSSTALATPAPLRWIVERCLAKDPDDRYASTRDLARDLSQTAARLSSMSEPGPAAAGTAPRRGAGARSLLVLLGAVLGLLTAFAVVRVRGLSRPETSPRLTRATLSPGLQQQPAFSPDGKFLAYVTDERGSLDVVVEPRGGGAPIRVAATDADETHPAWSPDGTKIAFCSARDHGGRLGVVLGQTELTELVDGRAGDLFIAPALGGAAVKLVDDGYYPAWSPDGKRVVFQSNRGGKWDLWTISAEGGPPARLTDDADFNYQPSWSPDGKWIAYASRAAGGVFSLRAVAAAGGAPAELTRGKALVLHPSWSPEGRSLVYSAFDNVTNLWELPVSNGKVAGAPRRVTLGPGQDVDATVSRDGKSIAFATTRTNGDIWELSLPSGALRQVTSETTLEQYPALSPDGKTLLAESDRTGRIALWTLDPSGRFREQVSAIDQNGGQWSADGRQVAYVLRGTIHLHTLGNVGGTDTGIRSSGAGEFSPDGTTLAFAVPGEPLSLYTVATKAVRRLGAVPGARNVGDASWSPDGRALAAHVQKDATRELWILPADGSAPRRLTDGAFEDSHARWSPANPDEILFLRDHRRICVISVATGRVRELPVKQDGTFFLDYPSFTRDGKKVFFSIHKKAGNIYVIER